jgi:serine/threonine protein kinase
VSKIRGYKIVKTLGHGGMATVYLAVQKSVDRYVALKVMSPDLIHEKSFTTRFLSEARIAARFRHPNIIAIHDVNVEKGLPYIAMEYVPGGSLSSERIESMSLMQKLAVVAQVADALGFLHGQNFIHRDVKPDNVIFREDDTAVLTDFGIARDESSDLRMTLTGSVIGTPYYMSPEQARGKKLDARSDLYSLGVMLYKLLTGEVPFDAEDALSIYIMHAKEAVPDLPDEFAMLDPVVKCLMAKLPEDRYPDSTTLIKEMAKRVDTSPTRLLNRSFEGVALEITGETEADEGETEATETSHQSDDKPDDAGAAEQTEILESSDPKAPPLDQAEAIASEPPKDPGFKHRLLILNDGLLDALKPILATAQNHVRALTDRVRQEPRLSMAVAAALVVLLLVVMLPDGDGPQSAEAILNRALQLADSDDAGQRFEAEALFNEVLTLEPGNQEARAGLQALNALNEHYSTGRDRDGVPRNSRPITPSPGSADEVQATAADAKQTVAANGTDQAVRRLLDEATLALAEQRLIRPGQDNAYAKFRAALELAPANAQAQQGLQAVADELLAQIEVALDAGDMERAGSLLSDARRIGQGQSISYASLNRRYEDIIKPGKSSSAQIESLLVRGEQALLADRLMRPEGDNAVSAFQSVLALDTGNQQARTGLDRVARRYLQLADQALGDGRSAEAENFLERAMSLSPALPGLAEFKQRLADLPAAVEPPPAERVPAADATIEVATLPQPVLGSNETVGSLLQQAEARLKTNQQLLAYALYKEVLAREPGHRAARRRLFLGAQQYIRLASRDIGNDDLLSARKQLSLAIAIDPGHPELEEVQRAYLTRLDSSVAPATISHRQDGLAEMRLKLLLSAADTASSRFANDPGNRTAVNEAADNYMEALKLDPRNPLARSGLNQLGQNLLAAGLAAARRDQPDAARWYLERAQVVIPGDPGLRSLAEALEGQEQ